MTISKRFFTKGSLQLDLDDVSIISLKTGHSSQYIEVVLRSSGEKFQIQVSEDGTGGKLKDVLENISSQREEFEKEKRTVREQTLIELGIQEYLENSINEDIKNSIQAVLDTFKLETKNLLSKISKESENHNTEIKQKTFSLIQDLSFKIKNTQDSLEKRVDDSFSEQIGSDVHRLSDSLSEASKDIASVLSDINSIKDTLSD